MACLAWSSIAVKSTGVAGPGSTHRHRAEPQGDSAWESGTSAVGASIAVAVFEKGPTRAAAARVADLAGCSQPRGSTFRGFRVHAEVEGETQKFSFVFATSWSMQGCNARKRWRIRSLFGNRGAQQRRKRLAVFAEQIQRNFTNRAAQAQKRCAVTFTLTMV